jgi:amino acid transporter
MNKDLKSILISLSIVLLYFYAAAGVIKIIWNSKKENVFDARVSFISVMMFIGTLFMLIVPYHLFGSQSVTGLYYCIIVFHIIYLFVGAFANSIIENHYE